MKAQFAALLTSRVAAAGLQALTFILFARMAGAAEVGVVGVVVGVGIFLATVADLGVAPYVSRARALGHESKVLAGLRLNLLSTLTLGLVFGVGTWTMLASSGAALALGSALVALSISLEKNSDTLLSVAYADNVKWIPAVSILSRRITGLGIVVALLIAWPPSAAAIAYGIAQLVGAAVGQVITRVSIRPRLISKVSTRLTFRSVLGESLSYLVNSLSAQARNLDVPIVALVGGATAAGYYSTAVRLVNPVMLVPSSLTSLILPHASRANEVHARRITWQLTIASLALYVPLIPLMLLAPWAVALLFGAEFEPAAPVLVLLLVALPAVGLSSPLASILQGRGRARAAALISASSAILALVGVSIGTVVAGAVGAAFATAVVFALKCIVLLAVILHRQTNGEQNGESS